MEGYCEHGNEFSGSIKLEKGHEAVQLVEALCYKLEGRWFESRCGRYIFNWPNPASRTMVLESTERLTEMSTRDLHGR
jgi:hypothetical protein